MASVTTMPRKPSSLRKSSVSTFFETVAGISAGSMAGTLKCEVITASTPAWMAARKGTSSSVSSRARLAVTVASAIWESVAVSPWPGKCFTVTSTW